MLNFLLIAAAAITDPAPTVAEMWHATPFGGTVYPNNVEYPPAARARGDQGTVPILLHIGVDGSLSCRAAGGETLARLRRESCELVASRWPFGPQLKGGKPRPTDVALNVVWLIRTAQALDDLDGATSLLVPTTENLWPPYASKAPENAIGITFDVVQRGIASNCRVTEPSKIAAFNTASCKRLNVLMRFLPAIDEHGRPRIAHAMTHIRWKQP